MGREPIVTIDQFRAASTDKGLVYFECATLNSPALDINLQRLM